MYQLLNEALKPYEYWIMMYPNLKLEIEEILKTWTYEFDTETNRSLMCKEIVLHIQEFIQLNRDKKINDIIK